MNPDILLLFDKTPGVLPLYERAEAWILEEFPNAVIKVGASQVSFTERYGFAYLWPPIRRVKGWPEVCLGVTFGLPEQLKHPRIAEAVEPYPGRWTHHVLVSEPEELDSQLMEWIRASHEFSMTKRRRK